MKKTLNAVGGIADALQLLAFVTFVVLGPFFWMWQLAAGGRFARLSVVLLFWLLSLAIISWEVRRKAITAVSLAVFLVWMVVLGFVFHEYL